MGNLPVRTDHLWCGAAPGPFDEVIDVRSPGEFAEDHIPNAINLPVLNDDERARVGTVYHQDGAFAARRLGAGLVSANIARHVATHFATQGKEYRPFIYCWRGGQRSASLGLVLAQIGWRVTILNGGYTTYRTHVRAELDRRPNELTFRVIAGATGTGKTRLLQALTACGAQVLDLEALANHRGSLLGFVGPQPPQKLFDSHLLVALQGFTPDRPVWVEAESHRIGNVYLPNVLWDRLRSSSGIELQCTRACRVQNLLADYTSWLDQPIELSQRLGQLDAKRGRRQIDEWHAMIQCRQWPDLVASLLAVHYDPAYDHSASRNYPQVQTQVHLEETDDEAYQTLAQRLHATQSGESDQETRQKMAFK